jgi:hypothetical protein
MKTKFHLGRGAAILACAASLAGTAAIVAPTAASAASTCPNKRLTLHLEGNPPLKYPVKAITVEGGVTCAEAYKVITGALEGKPLPGWKTASGQFEAPEGLVPQIAKKGSKKIKYAVQGG